MGETRPETALQKFQVDRSFIGAAPGLFYFPTRNNWAECRLPAP